MSLRVKFGLIFFIGLLGWAGLAALVYVTPPEPRYQLLAILLLVVAVIGTTAPIWGRIQMRITPKMDRKALPGIALRQAVWTGLIAGSVVVLQLSDLLDGIMILVVVVLFVLLETFLQQRRQYRASRSRSGTNKSNSRRVKGSKLPPPAPKSKAGEGSSKKG